MYNELDKWARKRLEQFWNFKFWNLILEFYFWMKLPNLAKCKLIEDEEWLGGTLIPIYDLFARKRTKQLTIIVLCDVGSLIPEQQFNKKTSQIIFRFE